jgi:alcohol dehydrogenase class IV
MDALAHNLEAFCAPGFHPMADGIALEGIRLIKKWLPVAFKDSKNIEARIHLMAASTMGATAFQKGLGAIHSLSHPVGAIYGKHHGLLNAIFTPYVLDYNRDFISDKMIRLGQYIDLESPSVDTVILWINELNKYLNIPSDLKSIGVNDHQIDKVVSQAMSDGSTPTNPRKMDFESVQQLFTTSINGYQK